MEIFEERTVVEKIHPTEKTKSEHASDFDLFINHFKLILENHNLIIKTPEYFHILLERFEVGTPITGISYIPIGCGSIGSRTKAINIGSLGDLQVKFLRLFTRITIQEKNMSGFSRSWTVEG